MSVQEINPILLHIVLVACLRSPRLSTELFNLGTKQGQLSEKNHDDAVGLWHELCADQECQLRNQLAQKLDQQTKELSKIMLNLPCECVENCFFQYLEFDKPLAALLLWCLMRDDSEEYQQQIANFSVFLANSYRNKHLVNAYLSFADKRIA